MGMGRELNMEGGNPRNGQEGQFHNPSYDYLLVRMCQIWETGNWHHIPKVWSEGYVATTQAAETNVYDGSKVACEFALGERKADAAASVKEKVLVTAWCRVCTGWKAAVVQM